MSQDCVHGTVRVVYLEGVGKETHTFNEKYIYDIK